MRKCALLILFLAVAVGWGQSFYPRYDFSMAPSSTFQQGLVGFVNPANSALLQAPEARYFWNTGKSNPDWGVFAAVPGLGFGAYQHHLGDYSVTDYRISAAFGDRSLAFGGGYGWSRGDRNELTREAEWSLGTVWRPMPYISLGAAGYYGAKSYTKQGVLELGLRPFGTSFLTLFGDMYINDDMRIDDAQWSAGAALQVCSGIDLVGRYFENEQFTLGVSLDFGFSSYAQQQYFDADQNQQYESHQIRIGGLRDNFLMPLLGRDRSYVPIELNGKVAYQTYRFAKDGAISFFDLLQDIQACGTDPRVRVLVLNMSDLAVQNEKAWEIHAALRQVRQQGKTVIAFIEDCGMNQYLVASAADRIVIDPEAMLMMPGYLFNRTYYKGTLEKLGLEFDEWRFMKYKTAAESFSRENMSEADREQLDAMLEDFYATMRKEVSESRALSPEQIDTLVNDKVILLADEAVEQGLADTLARWIDYKKILKAEYGKNLMSLKPSLLWDHNVIKDEWKARPNIALVYGIGVCAMDEGIKGRWLHKQFKQLAKDKSVKAVVFRVDSPGGESLPSDLVAEELRQCAKEKPVIVTQGDVAGSGGYWISMYGDRILAGPNTITGSIGVIGGWIWDDGFGEKLGMSADHVQRGKHIDAAAGVSLPLLGRIPGRPLTEEENQRVKKLVLTVYDRFIEKVAQGRHMKADSVRTLAGGRVYSGLDGLNVGLIDEIGGLLAAIELAKQDAGIEPDEQVQIIEIPEYKGWFDLSGQLSPIQALTEKDPVYRTMKLMIDHPYRPLFMVHPDLVPLSEE